MLAPEIEAAILKYAQQYNLDPNRIRALVNTESGGNKDAVSEVGAKGLMQIYSEAPIIDALRTKHLTKRPDLNTVDGQIQAGTAYLAHLRDTYNVGETEDRLLYMYNGGPKMRNAPNNATEAELAHAARRAGFPDFDASQNFNYASKVKASFDQFSGGDTGGSTTEINAANDQGSQVSASNTEGRGTDTSTLGGTNAQGQVSTSTTTTTPTTTGSSTNTTTSGTNAQVDEGGINPTVDAAYTEAQTSLEAAIKSTQASNANLNSNLSKVNTPEDISATLADNLANLRKFQANANEVLTDNMKQAVEADATRRETQKSIYGRHDYDPTDPQSKWNDTLAEQVHIEDRLKATQRATRRVADAPAWSGSWVYNTLFGNPYEQGARDLTTQASQLNQSTTAIRGGLAEQAKVAQSFLQNPQILNNQLQAKLKMLDIEQQTLTAEADLPLRQFEATASIAKTQASLAALQTAGENRTLDLQLKSVELDVKRAEAIKDGKADVRRERAQDLQYDISKLQFSNLTDDAEFNKTNKQLIQTLKLGKIKVESAEQQATLDELKRNSILLDNKDYMEGLTKNKQLELKQRNQLLLQKIQQQTQREQKGLVGGQVEIEALEQQEIKRAAALQEVTLDHQQNVWTNTLGKTTPLPNLAQDPGLARVLSTLAVGQSISDNPFVAAQTLEDVGAFNDADPTVALPLKVTIDQLTKQITAIPTIGSAKAASKLSAAEVRAAIKDPVNKVRTATNSGTMGAHPGGILPSTYLKVVADESNSLSKGMLADPAFVDKLQPNQSYAQMVSLVDQYSTETLGLKDITTRSNRIADYFKVAVDANNRFRRYNTIGLPQQTDIRVRGLPTIYREAPGTSLRQGGAITRVPTDIDGSLTSQADIIRLLGTGVLQGGGAAIGANITPTN